MNKDDKEILMMIWQYAKFFFEVMAGLILIWLLLSVAYNWTKGVQPGNFETMMIILLAIMTWKSKSETK